MVFMKMDKFKKSWNWVKWCQLWRL